MYDTLKTGSVLGKSETYLTNFKTYIGEIVMQVCSLYSSSKQKLYNKVLGKQFTGSDVSRSIAFNIFDGGDFDPKEHPTCAKIGRHARASAGTDFANLANSGSIEPANKIRTLERRSIADVQHAVSFIVGHCKTRISWEETKQVKLVSNGLVAVIPKLVRTQVAERIWTSYRDTLAPGDVTKLGRTAFLLTVVRFITSTER